MIQDLPEDLKQKVILLPSAFDPLVCMKERQLNEYTLYPMLKRNHFALLCISKSEGAMILLGDHWPFMKKTLSCKYFNLYKKWHL